VELSIGIVGITMDMNFDDTYKCCWQRFHVVLRLHKLRHKEYCQETLGKSILEAHVSIPILA
jgi:hypothetical protein